MFSFRLPDIGEGVAEGEIVKWNVAPGSKVEQDQDMVEVMTDKVTVKIPSPVAGTVKDILVPEGKVAKVGDILVTIDDGKGQDSTNLEVHEETQVSGKSPEDAPKEPRTIVSQTKVLATPAVRKLAKDLGVDIEKVKPTGPGGRVLADDVRNAAKSGNVVQEAPPQIRKDEEKVPEEKPHPEAEKTLVPHEHDEILEMKGLRRIIFEKMTKSKAIIPHFTVMEIVDLGKVIELRDDLRSQGFTVGYTPFFVKAASKVLREFPKFNAHYDEARKAYILRKQCNIGVAVDTPAGLTVAVVKDADLKSLNSIAEEINRLAEKARKNELKLSEVQDSTFTVSNVGSIGGVLSNPIINYPEVAILGVHRLLDDGIFSEKKSMFVSLSCDHRLIDGADAARFIRKIKEMLEKPSILLIER